MRRKEIIGIGLTLVLLAGCGKLGAERVQANFRESLVDGRLGFMLWLPEPTWRRMTSHTSGISSVVLDEKLHTSIDGLIELGIRTRHLPCSHQWLISEIGPADAGGILFVGICATPAEIKAVEKERQANVI